MQKKTRKPEIPIGTVLQPLMKLRAKVDRIINVTLHEKMGFGISQFRILWGLTIRPGITQKDIADFWDVTEASVSRQVKILERRNWIKRKTGLVATPLGVKTLKKARKIVDESFEIIFKKITDKKRKMATSILLELIKNI